MAGGGLEEELKRRLKLRQTREVRAGVGQDTRPASAPTPTHNCQMVDFFFSWTEGCSRDALGGGQAGRSL